MKGLILLSANIEIAYGMHSIKQNASLQSQNMQLQNPAVAVYLGDALPCGTKYPTATGRNSILVYSIVT
jgi:hypothetical protein